MVRNQIKYDFTHYIPDFVQNGREFHYMGYGIFPELCL